MSHPSPFRDGQIVAGTVFSEPMRIETVRADGRGSNAWSGGGLPSRVVPLDRRWIFDTMLRCILRVQFDDLVALLAIGSSSKRRSGSAAAMPARHRRRRR